MDGFASEFDISEKINKITMQYRYTLTHLKLLVNSYLIKKRHPCEVPFKENGVADDWVTESLLSVGIPPR